MKKRLRKKLHLGEFRELGFAFFADLEVADSDADAALFDQFVALMDENEMVCEGAWGEGQVDLYISTGLVDTDNDNRREQFLAKVEKLAGLKNIKAGSLGDCCCCDCGCC